MTTDIIQNSKLDLSCSAGNSVLQESAEHNNDALTVKQIQLNIGLILIYPEAQYVIINVTPEYVTLCKIKVSEFDIHTDSISNIMLAISTGQVEVTQIKQSVIDIRQLIEPYKKDFILRKQIIRRIVDSFGPDYLVFNSKTPKLLINEIAKEERLSKRTLRNWVLEYLQSGLSEASLLDKRCLKNAGRPSQIK